MHRDDHLALEICVTTPNDLTRIQVNASIGLEAKSVNQSCLNFNHLWVQTNTSAPNAESRDKVTRTLTYSSHGCGHFSNSVPFSPASMGRP